MIADVRRAVPADARPAARIQLELWQQAYAELLPAAVLLGDPTARETAWEQRIAEAGPVLLGYEGEQAVGLAAVAAQPAEDGAGEIELLGVLPRWARRGHGGRLLAAAAAELRRPGAERGCWWAVQDDRSIERFLAHAGWFPDGRRRVLDTGEGTLTEVRYSGKLDLVLI